MYCLKALKLNIFEVLGIIGNKIEMIKPILKILVSLVRFRLWAPLNKCVPKAAWAALGIFCRFTAFPPEG
jgi:hypothetical protein